MQTQALNETISDIESAKKAIIANETEPNKLYCAKNIMKFQNGIPKQSWVLCLQGKKDLQRVHLCKEESLSIDKIIAEETTI